MCRTTLFLVLLCFPEPAWTAEAQSTGGMSLFVSFMQMSLALLVVIGLILLTYFGATRLIKSVPAFQQSGRYIRVIEVRPMGPRKALILIEVGGEYLLLSSSEHTLSMVKQIGMLEEIEVLDDQPGQSFLAFLKRATVGRSRTA